MDPDKSIIKLKFMWIKVFISLIFLISLFTCQGNQSDSSLFFDYINLSLNYSHTKTNSHFPLTTQRAENLHPSVSDNNYLFYTSNVEGSGDIWIRDLKRGNSFALIKNPSEQYKPSVNSNGDRLVFVSENRDENGDLYRLDFNPDELFKQYVEKRETKLLWSSSYNISLDIEKWSKNKFKNEDCHGQYLETDPDLNSKGDQLIFVTDRCTPGNYNIWLAKFKRKKITHLQPLTKLGGTSPRFSPAPYEDKIVFISYRETKKRGRLFLLSLSSFPYEAIEVPLVSGDKNNFIYNSPDFLGDSDTLVYTSVRNDTNQDDLLSNNDNAGIYTCSLKGSRLFYRDEIVVTEKQILEDSSILYGLSYSKLAGGSILYAAKLHNSINIYLSPTDGIIPKKKNIKEQYQLSRYYIRENEDRYLLALNSVLDNFRNDDLYTFYEAKILIDRLEFYRKKDKQKEIDYIESNLKVTNKNNPYINFYYGFYNYNKENSNTLPYILKFQKNISKKNLSHLSEEQIDFLHASIIHKLADEYKNQNKIKEALKELKTLNNKYPNYPFRVNTLFSQAELELIIKKEDFPLVLNTIVKEAQPSYLEIIYKKIFELYQEKGKSSWIGYEKIDIKEKDNEKKADLFIRTIFKLLQANQLLKELKYKEALLIASEIREAVPQQKIKFSFSPQNGWNGIYISALKIISQCYNKLGKRQSAYNILFKIVSNYPKNIQINPNTSSSSNYSDSTFDTELDSSFDTSFIEFIKYLEDAINSHLDFISSLAKRHENHVIEKDKQKKDQTTIANTIDYLSDKINAAINNLDQDNLVYLKRTQIISLAKLCKSYDQKKFVFNKLDSVNTYRYINFCKKNSDNLKIAKQKKIPAKELLIAIRLLYAITQTKIETLNTFLFHIRRLDRLGTIANENSIKFLRLAADVADTENQYLLKVLKKDVVKELILGDEDIFNTESFENIKRGYHANFYQVSLPKDLYSLYGYAYTIIKKNISREKFYFTLAEKHEHFTISFLDNYKKQALYELKNAEYILRYILNTNPSHTDSYLLLGWLLQYIDNHKKETIKYRANIFQRLFGKEFNTEKDGIIYRDHYTKYFPNNYYEENIGLYHQALKRLEESTALPQSIGRIHLNLANNYFTLNNFGNANEHYQKVVEISLNSKNNIFENKKQEILFYFNFSRTLIYEGNYSLAISYLQKCYNIYEQNDYLPLKNTHNSLYLIQNYDINEELPRIILPLERKGFAATQEKFKQSRTRLALLSILSGLAYWQMGEPKQAIVHYLKAEHHIYKEKPILDKAFPHSSLLNFIALAYQDINELEKSDIYANLEINKLTDTSLEKDNSRYQPKTYCAKSLGCFIDFSEDSSVIGKGRNPYGFSPLRRYELSLSIQLENMISRGDLASTNKIIEKQQKLISDYDLDVKHGKSAYLNSLNQEALIAYKAENYQEAMKLFSKAALEAYDFSNMDAYKINTVNRFHVLLNILEYSSISIKEGLKKTENALDDWNDFEDIYRKEVLKKFIIEKRKNFYDYSYNPKQDGVALEEQIQAGIQDMLAIKSNLIHYKASFTKKDGEIKSIKKSQKLFDESTRLLISVIANIAKDIKIEKSAIIIHEYNLARLYFDSGKLYLARDLLEKITKDTYEFNLIKEEILSHLLASQVFKKLYHLYENQKDNEKSLFHMENVIKLFFSKTYQYDNIYRDAKYITKTAASFYIQEGDELKALNILEQSWKLYLEWQYFRYPINFPNQLNKNIHEGIRKKSKQLRNLDKTEYTLRVNRKDIKEIQERKITIQNDIKENKAKLLKNSHRHSAFLKFNYNTKVKIIPNLEKGQVLMRFFSNSNFISAWCFFDQKRSFILEPIKNKSEGFKTISRFWKVLGFTNVDPMTNTTRTVINKCIGEIDDKNNNSPANSKIKDIIFVATEELFALDLQSIVKSISADITKPTFRTYIENHFLSWGSSISKLQKEKDVHLFNTGEAVPLLYSFLRPTIQKFKVDFNTDSIAELWKAKYKDNDDDKLQSTQKTKSNIGLEKIFIENPALSFVMVDSKNNDYSYQKVALFYEILRSYGIASLALVKKDESANLLKLLKLAGKESYTQDEWFLFGFPGFDGAKTKDIITSKYRSLKNSADLAYNNKNYKKAKQLYIMAGTYLAWHPDKLNLAQELILYLFRLDVLLASDGINLEPVDTLLKTVQDEGNKSFEKKIFNTIIISLNKAKYFDEATIYLDRFQKRFPEEKTEFRNKAYSIKFVSNLDQNEYKQLSLDIDNFSKSFKRVYPYLKKLKEFKNIEDLFKHKQYNAALKLLKEWEKEKVFDQRIGDLYFAIQIEKHILSQAPLPSLSNIAKRHPYFKMLLAAWRGEWGEYEIFADKVIGTENIAHTLWRKNLYKQWRNFLSKKEVDFGLIAEIKQDKTSPLYIRLLERSLWYHLVTQNLIIDAYNEYSYILYSFLEKEGLETSINRKLWMTLDLVEKYLDIGDIAIAKYFFNLYLKDEKKAIFDTENAYRAARLGTILDISNFDLNYKKYYSSWHPILEKTQQGKSTLTLFYKNLKKNERAKLITKVTYITSHLQNISTILNTKTKVSNKDIAKIYDDINIAIQILKLQAVQKKSLGFIFNLSLLEQALQYHYIERSNGIINPIPLYQNLLKQIQNKIPKKQILIAIVNAANSLLNFRIKSNNIRITLLKNQLRTVNAKMHKYLQRISSNRPYYNIQEDLQKYYRNLLNSNSTSLHYLWLPNVHSLAPISLKREERVFQILDLEQSLEHELLDNYRKKSYTLEIQTLGERNFNNIHNSDKEEIFWAKRIYTMEKLGINYNQKNIVKNKQEKDKTKQVKPHLKFYHIFSNVNIIDGNNFPKKILQKIKPANSPWFFSSNFMKISTKKQLIEYNYFLKNLAQSLKGPGIISLQKPSDLNHAHFIRNYYITKSNKTIGISNITDIADRFTYSYNLSGKINTSTLGKTKYRLLTGSFFKNN